MRGRWKSGIVRFLYSFTVVTTLPDLSVHLGRYMKFVTFKVY